MHREFSDVPIFASAMLVTLSPTNLPALERHAENRLHFRHLCRHWAAYIFQHFTNAKNNALVLLSFWLSFYFQQFYLRSLTLDFRLVNLWLLQKNLFFSFSTEGRQNQRKNNHCTKACWQQPSIYAADWTDTLHCQPEWLELDHFLLLSLCFRFTDSLVDRPNQLFYFWISIC